MSKYAFPCPTYESNGRVIYQEGMDLREWLAGKAMQGLLAGMYRDSGMSNLCELPREATLIADAMILELSK